MLPSLCCWLCCRRWEEGEGAVGIVDRGTVEGKGMGRRGAGGVGAAHLAVPECQKVF